jgi:hypothetical protein
MHGIDEAFGVSDRKVADILGWGKWPEDDIQAWDDEIKNRFLDEYFSLLDKNTAQEIGAESLIYMEPKELRAIFTDPAEVGRQLSGHMYLYMEPHLSDQIERSRKLIEEKAA